MRKKGEDSKQTEESIPLHMSGNYRSALLWDAVNGES